MKRISIGFIVLSLISSAAFAAFPTSAVPFEVNIPNLAGGFEFNFTALYVRPSNNDEDYAVIVDSPFLTESTQALYELQSITPSFDWAMSLGIGYIFPDSGSDVRLSWFHLFEHDNTDSVSVDPDGTQRVVPPFDTDFVFGFETVFDQAQGTEDFKYDALDLDVGQFINLGTRLQLRLFGGLRYAHIERDFNTQFDEQENPGILYFTTENNSKFDGIGPLFGEDSSYHLGYCLGFVTHLDTALLVGDVKSSNTFTLPVLEDDVLISTVTNLTSEDLTRFVPGFDAKLGLDWSYEVACDAWFSVEAGYQWTHYLEVFDRLEPTRPTAISPMPQQAPALTFVDNQRILSNFGFDGPYLSLNFKV